MLLLIGALLLATPAQAQFGPLIESAPPRPVMVDIVGQQQMVAAAHPLAAQAGRQILAAGGTAMDAVIAMQLMLTLVEPQSSGIGGGGFVLYQDARTGQPVSLDGRETAPSAATPTQFLGTDGKPVRMVDSYQGGRAVGVPGMVALMAKAHRQHGKLPWKTLFAPAITAAQNGFPVTPRLASMLVNAQSLVQKFPAARAQLMDAQGQPRAAGSLYRNPALARFYRRIAQQGSRAFYSGANARQIAQAVRRSPVSPARLTEKDLAAYSVQPRDPLCGTYRRFRVCSMAPPSSGAVALIQALKMIEPHDMRAMGSQSADAIHIIAEALAIAFADREVYLADPAFVDVPVNGLVADSYVAERARLIDLNRAGGPFPAGTPDPATKTALAPGLGIDVPSTSHMVSADRNGNVASWTGTVQAPFGAFLMVNGYLLNNEMTDFAFTPDREGVPVANLIAPGKRPRSSMSPTLVYDSEGRVVMALGSAGGARIIAHVLKTLIAHLDWRLGVQAAMDYPNFFKTPQGLEIEPGPITAVVRAGLEAKGHKIIERANVSGLTALSIRYLPEGGRVLTGGADSRREGVALAD